VTLELGQPTSRKPPFKYSAFARVSFSDTDAQGVVYYGRYMPYFDLSRTEYFRHLGIAAGGAMIGLAMRAMEVEYLAPARFDDTIEVFVRIARIGRTSVTFEHAAYRVEDDLLLATARQVNVHLDLAERRPLSLPDQHRAAIAAFEGADLEL
jgi:acyl-CoA thioester hydrolase